MMQSEPGSPSVSVSVSSPTGSRLRKKHKRLDAICEHLYKQNHRESTESKGDTELRRSSRLRRPPVLLDVSPSPAKRRRQIDKNLNLKSLKSYVKAKEESDAGAPESWRSRLRSSGKRSPFHDLAGKEEELDDQDLMVVKLKRQGRVKVVDGLGNGDIECEDTVDDVKNECEENLPCLGSEVVRGNEGEPMEGDASLSRLDESEEKGRLDDMDLEKTIVGNHYVDKVEQHDSRILEELGIEMDGKNGSHFIDVSLSNDVEDGGNRDGDEGVSDKVNEISLKVPKDAEVDGHDSANKLGRSRIKQGRRCGLCGCSNDGKPPKRLVEDFGDSANEVYGGSSDSEDANYDIWDGFGDESGWLGRLLGPINDRYGIAGIWVHQHCAVWSPEVYFAGLGCLKNVRAALCRGRALKCSRCGRPGATIGCRVDRCPKTYHLPCARASSCIFDHRKFLIACTDHRHLFQPHGNQLVMQMKKLKAKKMRLDMRKMSNDAWRKDVEAEERWLENCGEDEEFLKRESRRLHRDMMRIAPEYIGGSDSEFGKLFEGWESVAGLQDVIQCMKEVVLLPLLYPEVFNNLGITPPRGVLLHGYPGTGKTLVVRALIGCCARGDKRIAYFARKGADCLGKYVGDAERQLRLLFQVAERSQPSIIFFDEIDGLAPCRTRQQDQTHSSVVSTLLALMDGLKSRGSVVVIGATNRPEAVDPALRRPGRFDREIYFPLPSVKDRAAIISLHTRRWPRPVSGSLLKWIATRTVGFAGADLQALCTQAAIIALRRNSTLQQILSSAREKPLATKCSPFAFVVEDRDWLKALARAPLPCSRREAGMAAYDIASSPLAAHLIPCLLRPLTILLVSLHIHEQLWLPPSLVKAASAVKNVIISSLEKNKLPCEHWWSHVDNFLKDTEIVKEMQTRLKFAGILIGEVMSSSDDSIANESDNDNARFEPSVVHCGGIGGMSFSSRMRSGFRVLISGSPRGGQRHLAACILHCFVGNVEIQKIDLATVSQEGRGEMVQGLTRILMKCAQFQSCMIFMPRIDLWAVETCHQVTDHHASSVNHQLPHEKLNWSTKSQATENESSSLHSCKTAELAGHQGPTENASHVWSSLVEQIESICVSTSLMIMATSELPYPELPSGIRQFFKNDFSNGAQPTCLVDMLPRFAVHIDQDFNHDEVISISATELLRNTVKSFIQLVHERAHIPTSSTKNYEICDVFQGYFDAENRTHGLIGENEDWKQCPLDPSKLPPHSSSRNSKGKSSILLAISTFGYQILRYPHFAELCWVTSKLKEGPCADVSGPWKGWPFNSCIIRPTSSLDKVTVCTSISLKSRERSGLVRGLIAVGLLAYRGVYRSLKEVSFEVRKVLELLVGQVNEKIHTGKEKYQYVRLLSQVAYLEDVVSSWAHALQSFDLDDPMQVANANPNTVKLPNTNSFEDNSGQSERKENACNEFYNEPEQFEVDPRRLAYQNHESVELSKGENGFGCPNSEDRKASLSEDGPAQHIAPCDHRNTDGHPWNSIADNLLAVNVPNHQNGTTLEPEVEEIPALAGRDTKSLKHSNGFSLSESVYTSEIGPSNSEEIGEVKFSGPEKSCNQSNGLTEGDRSNCAEPYCNEHGDTIESCKSETNISSSDHDVLCSYQCCSGCLNTLHSLIEKMLTSEWESNRNHWAVEDVHEAVASLSVDILSSVRRIKLADNANYSFDKKMRDRHPEKLPNCTEWHKCHCKSTEDTVVLPEECECHTLVGCASTKANYQISHSGPSLRYVFRDGFIFSIDSEEDVSFHCKFETLCLCSIIDSVVMMKQPFD